MKCKITGLFCHSNVTCNRDSPYLDIFVKELRQKLTTNIVIWQFFHPKVNTLPPYFSFAHLFVSPNLNWVNCTALLFLFHMLSCHFLHLQISAVRLPLEPSNPERLKGFGYAEFDDVDSLLRALSLNEEVRGCNKNLVLYVCIFTHLRYY